jgi:hypothetical protein
MIFHVTMITYDGCCIFLISFCGPTILLGNPVDSYMNYVVVTRWSSLVDYVVATISSMVWCM